MSMIKVKTAELIGAALDWAVSQAFGVDAHAAKDINDVGIDSTLCGFLPVETCRRVVKDTFGDEVEVPEELMQ